MANGYVLRRTRVLADRGSRGNRRVLAGGSSKRAHQGGTHGALDGGDGRDIAGPRVLAGRVIRIRRTLKCGDSGDGVDGGLTSNWQYAGDTRNEQTN
jgi:hypothetical protein